MSGNASFKILLVDEDIAFQDQLHALLLHRQYDVTSVQSAVDAIEKAATSPFDLIIMDVHSVELDAITMLEQFYKACPDTFIFATSASDSRDRRDYTTLHKIRKMGVAGAFRKPMDYNDLLEAVEDLLTSKLAAEEEPMNLVRLPSPLQYLLSWPSHRREA